MTVLTKKRNLSKSKKSSKSRKHFNKSRKNQSRKRNMRGGTDKIQYEVPKGVEISKSFVKSKVEKFETKPEPFVKPDSNSNITRFHSLGIKDFAPFSKNPQKNVNRIKSLTGRRNHNSLNNFNLSKEKNIGPIIYKKKPTTTLQVPRVSEVPGLSNLLYNATKTSKSHEYDIGTKETQGASGLSNPSYGKISHNTTVYDIGTQGRINKFLKKNKKPNETNETNENTAFKRFIEGDAEMPSKKFVPTDTSVNSVAPSQRYLDTSQRYLDTSKTYFDTSQYVVPSPYEVYDKNLNKFIFHEGYATIPGEKHPYAYIDPKNLNNPYDVPSYVPPTYGDSQTYGKTNALPIYFDPVPNAGTEKPEYSSLAR